MADLARLLADLERVAEVCNRFTDSDLGRAAFNIAIAALDLPPRPTDLPVMRARQAVHRYDALDNTATVVIPAVR